MSYLPTVFILGAGASCHTGAPLLQNFLSSAMNVMDDLGDDAKELYPIFEKVFVYIAENDALEPLLGCDFRNIEHVFGMVDLEARVLPRSQEIRDALLRVILETLARTIKPEEKRPLHIACNNTRDVADVESTPLGTLVSLVADRARDGRPNEPCRNTIISLNYDTLVEQAMQSTGVSNPTTVRTS